jgi:trk system potassium uptake protein TrkH
LGVVTVAASLAMLSKKKISLSQRSTMQEAVSAHKVGGIAKLTRFILTVTFSIELIGALLLMPVFCGEFGLKGVWYSFFHSTAM